MFKWILGGIVFLVIFAGLCYLYYHQTTAPYRENTAELDEIVRQSEKQRTASTAKPTEQAADASADSTPPTAEKPVNEVAAEVGNNTEAAEQQTNSPSETVEEKDVPVSPFGFGPYPEVPEGWAGGAPTWMLYSQGELPTHLQRAGELFSRVLIKLWNEGDTNWTGASMNTSNGRVYPNYPDTVYITVEDSILPDGTIKPIITRKMGTAAIRVEDLLNPPSHIKVLDIETSGIDPYEYLDLP